MASSKVVAQLCILLVTHLKVGDIDLRYWRYAPVQIQVALLASRKLALHSSLVIRRGWELAGRRESEASTTWLIP